MNTTPPLPMPEPPNENNWKRPFKGRVTVVEHLYHQTDGEPSQTSSTYSLWLDSDEQPFCRRFKVASAWSDLPKGWIEPDKCSVLVLTNTGESPIEITFAPPIVDNEPRDMHSPPRKTQGDWVPHLVVFPKTSCRFQPVNLELIHLRSGGELSQGELTLLPK
jgi:hypothetical protein